MSLGVCPAGDKRLLSTEALFLLRDIWVKSSHETVRKPLRKAIVCKPSYQSQHLFCYLSPADNTGTENRMVTAAKLGGMLKM